MSKVQRSRPGGTSALGRTLTPAVEAPVIGSPPAQSRTTGLPNSQTPVVRDSGSPASVEPRWRQLLRKEARLRIDQADDLASLRRRITRQRRSSTEILTDNTLIRVAVDLLLAHADELHGDTEDELRNSLGISRPGK